LDGSSFTGFLGPGLAAFFFLAGLAFAAVSIRSSSNAAAAGTHLILLPRSYHAMPSPTSAAVALLSAGKMQNLSSGSAAAESYSDHDSLPTDSNDGLVKGDATDELLTPPESNEITGEPAGCLPLQNTELVGEEARQFDNLAASDGTPSPISSEYAQDNAVSAEYAQDDAGLSEGVPNLESTSDPNITLPKKQDLDETLTSDVMLLDSDDVVPIQEISSGAAVLAASHPDDKVIEQNPEIHNKDEAYPSMLPDYTEHVSADGMIPPGLDDLPMGSSEPGDGEEILGKDLYRGESEFDNQNKQFKAAPSEQSFSSAGVPAPSLVSTASKGPVGQIVVPASVDPTQENAVAALQILKVHFMSPLLDEDSCYISFKNISKWQIISLLSRLSWGALRLQPPLFSTEPILFAVLRLGP
jgi:hypothetical protein